MVLTFDRYFFKFYFVLFICINFINYLWEKKKKFDVSALKINKKIKIKKLKINNKLK